MAKMTICIQNPARVSISQRSLIIERDGAIAGRIPLEDIWVVILDSRQVIMTAAAMSSIVDAGIGMMTCGTNHMPNGLLLPIGAHSRHAEIVDDQLAMSKPLKKRLWQRIVRAKISNQANALNLLGHDGSKLLAMVREVRSDDGTNRESVAAAAYFKELIPVGGRRASAYTPALDYGYAVLRAGIGRETVGGGWLVSRGIHHRSIYNAFNLVDDLIEPYRPIVDLIALSNGLGGDLSPESKTILASAFEYLVSMPDGEETTVQSAISRMLDSLRASVIEEDDSLLKLPIINKLEKASFE